MAYDAEGFEPERRRITCETCQGRGYSTLFSFNCMGGVRPVSSAPCWHCDGDGSIDPAKPFRIDGD